MDHVHIELNKLGATMKTTFWNKKISYPIETPDPVQPQQPQQPPAPTTFDTSGGSTDGTDHHHDSRDGGAGAIEP
jgi:hypothetical protein